jgi:hypothetical protein
VLVSDGGTGTQLTTTPCDRTFAMTLLDTPSANGVVAEPEHSEDASALRVASPTTDPV